MFYTRTIFLICLLSTSSLFSNPLVDSEELIGGIVNPATGQLTLQVTDLVAKGAESLALKRIYIAPQICHSYHAAPDMDEYMLYGYLRENYRGWMLLPELHMLVFQKDGSPVVRLSLPEGRLLDFTLSGPNLTKTTLTSPPFGISNLSDGKVGGQFDPRNTRISYLENGSRILVHAHDGTMRHYRSTGKQVSSALLYQLEKETLPHGKVIRYQYDNAGHLNLIQSLDPSEQIVYTQIQLNGWRQGRTAQGTTPSGLSLTYQLDQRILHSPINDQDRQDPARARERKPKYIDIPSPFLLSSVKSPLYAEEKSSYSARFLLDTFQGKENTFSCEYASFANDPHLRVKKLLFPTGANDQLCPLFEIDYQSSQGEAGSRVEVKRSDGIRILTHFSSTLLPLAIQWIGQEGALKKEKLFSWNEKSWLESLEIRDGEKRLMKRISYVYDNFGNPIEETLTGDLTGSGHEESFTIHRVYSQDGRNLLLMEQDEEGKVTCLDYVPHTNLLLSKLTKIDKKIILREFYEYDECLNLIHKTSDDGTSEDPNNLSAVTQRRMTRYHLRSEAPYLHLPEWIEEKYLDLGQEKFLLRRHLTYDFHGNVMSEKLYDAEGNEAYTLHKTYNERGDLLSETNHLGQKAIYSYDTKGRLIKKSSFSGKIETSFVYDALGRALEKTERGNDGITRTEQFAYDTLGRLVDLSDSFQNRSHFTCDPLTNQVTKRELPQVSSIVEQPIPVVEYSTYDCFGRATHKTDANGNTKQIRYNVYGSPAEILYPNGEKESTLYTKGGKLARHTNAEGVVTVYLSDELGRITSKTVLSPQGEELARESFIYNGKSLLSKTDRENNCRSYIYDGAGRKVREVICGRISDYVYDSMGYLALIWRYNRDNTLLIQTKRDLVGNTLKETLSDIYGHILYKIAYAYDSDNRIIQETRFIDGKEALTGYVYDSFGRVVEERDPLGHVTKISYDEQYKNALDQRVLQIKKRDPRKILYIETQDAYGKAAKIERLDPDGATLSVQERFFDACGNLTHQKEHVYKEARFQKTELLAYTYTDQNLLATSTRAVGTKDSMKTAFTYTPSGKLRTKTLPDKTVLTYTYHPLGWLSSLSSSDGKIQHTFVHDKLGHLLYAADKNQNLSIERRVDPFGNVLYEGFSNGLSIRREMDQFDRTLSLTLAQEGEVHMSYDPLFLKGVSRISKTGDLLYHQQYENYDLDGNLLSEQLIENVGRISHTHDLSGRTIASLSPYFEERLSYDPCGNILSSTTFRYAYDGLSNLIREHCALGSHTYTYDSVYNRTQKDEAFLETNDLNQLIAQDSTQFSYDLNGNLIQKKSAQETVHFTYNALNQLIETATYKSRVTFTYDPLGRRMTKTLFVPKAPDQWQESSHENYLYDGWNEVATFTADGKLKNLRTLGLNRQTIGIEIGDKIYAALLDFRNNIWALIDTSSHTLHARYSFTAFGEELEKSSKKSTTLLPLNPWRYSSERTDAETGLIYSERGYYDPELGRWLTPDFEQINPYCLQ